MRYNLNGTMDFNIQQLDSISKAPDTLTVTPLYTESQKIKEMKYKHLQDLMEVKPKDFHSFNDNLKHLETQYTHTQSLTYSYLHTQTHKAIHC